MTNDCFTGLSQEEKLVKLKTTLRSKTSDGLTPEELKAIVGAVRLDRQYFIRVHYDFDDMISDLIRLNQYQTRIIIGSVYASQTTLQHLLYQAAETGDAITAVVDHTNRKNGIYIFLPKKRIKEGTTKP